MFDVELTNGESHAEDDRAVRPFMPAEIGWREEDQEDDEVSGPSEETRTPVKMNDPHAPSQKEREQHEMTHLPFRSWCWKCVFGRGKEMLHRRNKDEKVMPEVHLDFMFFGPKDSPQNTVPCLVMREVVSNMMMAAVDCLRLSERWRGVPSRRSHCEVRSGASHHELGQRGWPAARSSWWRQVHRGGESSGIEWVQW